MDGEHRVVRVDGFLVDGALDGAKLAKGRIDRASDRSMIANDCLFFPHRKCDVVISNSSLICEIIKRQ